MAEVEGRKGRKGRKGESRTLGRCSPGSALRRRPGRNDPGSYSTPQKVLTDGGGGQQDPGPLLRRQRVDGIHHPPRRHHPRALDLRLVSAGPTRRDRLACRHVIELGCGGAQ